MEPAYAGPTYSGAHGYPSAPDNVNGAIKCQQISGGDGYATMGDGTQTYMFSFGERIWKSIKYEEVYLHAYASVSVARLSIGRYIDFYNTTRPHSSLEALTPDQVYFNRLPESMAA